MSLSFRNFKKEEHQTWSLLFERQMSKRKEQMVDLFSEGLETLGIGPERIPELPQVNSILESKTGFKGVPVEGLKKAGDFFQMLARREFPVGNFIRSPKDLAYTPAPDVFHDMYGHLPFFTNLTYANFCEEFGKMASYFREDHWVLKQFERLFWFGVEFALVKTPQGQRIFGAGIASSFAECHFALSDQPDVRPFNLEEIRHQEFQIDDFQRKLFLLENPEQLYCCLSTFEISLPIGPAIQIVS